MSHKITKRGARNKINVTRIEDLKYICASNFACMENTKKYTGLFWALFILSVIAFFGLYVTIGGSCIMILPFVCTFLAKALDIM